MRQSRTARLPFVAALLAATASAGCAAAGTHAGEAPAPAAAGLQESIVALLQAYGRKDTTTLMAMADPARVAWYGTDAAEVNVGAEALARQFREDAMLWDSVSFGPLQSLHVEQDGRLATALFDVPTDMYRPGGRKDHFLLRMSMAWRRGRDGRWRLAQAMNAVPSSGQSAAEIIRRSSGGNARPNP